MSAPVHSHWEPLQQFLIRNEACNTDANRVRVRVRVGVGVGVGVGVKVKVGVEGEQQVSRVTPACHAAEAPAAAQPCHCMHTLRF